MADVRRLLSLNMFHASVTYPEPVMQAGIEVPVRHNIFGLYRRTRIARIRAYEKYLELAPNAPDREEVTKLIEEIKSELGQ